MTFYKCYGYLLGPPRSVRQRYGSKDPDPYQNVNTWNTVCWFIYHIMWLQAMAVYIWPPDNKEVKTRVVTAMGLLVSAKVMLFSIPIRTGLIIYRIFIDRNAHEQLIVAIWVSCATPPPPPPPCLQMNSLLSARMADWYRKIFLYVYFQEKPENTVPWCLFT